MDDASNFLPLYLRFVRGIIDTNDLPLNVSREILQEHHLVDTIKKAVTKRMLDSLKALKKDSFDKYKEFWNEYGLVLKEGPAEDWENKDLIASLLLFASTYANSKGSDQGLDDYLERMSDDQDKIYYCVADTYEAAANSPHIEGLKSKGIEVLLLTDRIDEWVMAGLMEYQGKELVNVAKEDISDEDETKKVLNYVPSAVFPAIILPAVFLNYEGSLVQMNDPKVISIFIAFSIGILTVAVL